MRFTKADIKEIAERLAVITKRDSEFPQATIPLNDSERIPVIQYIPALQDYENRLLPLSDLRSLVLADTDQTLVGCLLSVTCTTEGASILIKSSRGQATGQSSASYQSFYGEVVTVTISADGYDTWYESVTMTQDHTLSVSLNKTGEESGGGGGDDPSAHNYKVVVFNTQGASIRINNVQVTSGQQAWFTGGATVDISVSLSGYKTKTRYIQSLTANVEWTVTFTDADKENVSGDYIRFRVDHISLDSDGAPVDSGVDATIPWEIISDSVYDAPTDPQPPSDPDETEQDFDGDPEDYVSGDTAVTVTDDLGTMVAGDTLTLPEGFDYYTGNGDIVAVNGNVITAVNPGATYLYAYPVIYVNGVKNHGSLDKCVKVTVVQRQGSLEPTGIRLSNYVLNFDTYHYNAAYLYPTVEPVNAANKTVTWSVEKPSDGGGASGTVTADGLVSANTDDCGYFNVIASTVNGLTARCKVYVSSRGTVIDSVSPRSLSVPYTGGEYLIDVMSHDNQGTHSGYYPSDNGGYGSPILMRDVEYDPVSGINRFTLKVKENEGNARGLWLRIRGAKSGGVDGPESLRTVQVSQEGSKIVRSVKNSLVSIPASGGDFEMYFTSAVEFAYTAVTQAVIDSAWVSVDGSSIRIDSGLNPLWTREQLAELYSFGTVDGVVIDLGGKSAVMAVKYTVSSNTSGSVRTATMTFPGNVVFTINQKAE